jgi:RNA polymerase sigma-70 factor (ECF subfamily)
MKLENMNPPVIASADDEEFVREATRLSRMKLATAFEAEESLFTIDFELMRRLKSGDALALNELMIRWQTPLVSFIQRSTGSQEDALDLAQETFFRVYESRDRYQPSGKFSTWLFAIATNLSRNLARWRDRHPVVPLDEPFDEDRPGVSSLIAAPGDSPSDCAERNEIVSSVRGHVQKLPRDLRAVVLLFEYQELGYEEIAAMLGCTRKAVEARLYRARQVLRKSLAQLKANRLPDASFSNF